MQFGRVLAFSTLVLASPTPMNLDDRGATISISGITESLKSATSTINNIVAGNQANIVAGLAAAVAPVTPLTSAAVSAAVGLGATAIDNVESTVSSVGQIVVSDIQQTVTNLTQLVAQLNATITAAASSGIGAVQNDIKNLAKAANTLITTLAFTNLNGLLTLTASASTNLGQVVAQEVANLKALVDPFVTALQGLNASLSGSVGTTAPTIASSVANAIGTFVSQVSQIVPTISS